MHAALAGIVLLAGAAGAQTPGGKDPDCERIKQEIKESQEKLAAVSTSLERTQAMVDDATRKLQGLKNDINVMELRHVVQPVLESHDIGRDLAWQLALAAGIDRPSLSPPPVDICAAASYSMQELKPRVDYAKRELDDLLDRLGDCKKTIAAPWPTETTPTTTPTPGPTQPDIRSIEGIDPCLVGTWRSISVESPSYVVRPSGTGLGGDFTQKGGAGIVLKVEEDGTETIDYSAMEPLKIAATGLLNQWSGTATGKITAENGKAAVLSVEKSDLTLKSTRNGATQTSAMKGLGPASLGENKPDPSYTCDETTLKFKMLVLTLTFKREAGATREKTP